jgi:hypothetical protein
MDAANAAPIIVSDIAISQERRYLIMTNRERELKTLGFQKVESRGSVQETFYPWALTAQRFKNEGMPAEIADNAKDITNNLAGNKENQSEKYLPVVWGEGVMNYETWLGFDPVRRIHFVLPFRRFDEFIIEETENYILKQDIYGRQVKYFKDSGIEVEHKHVVNCEDDWKRLKAHGDKELEKYFTDEEIYRTYAPLKEGHDRGDYSIRLNIEGFFWVQRELLGIEPHFYAFYDSPEMLHDINQYVLNVYSTKLMQVIELLQPDVVYLMEDLSGKNGPMLSPTLFDEFVGQYYKQLIPILKKRGVGFVFVDTDGEFKQLIPNFIDAGVDGFLPMDVNAGMDIVEVRNEFPGLRFIGGYNKLCISEGKEAIDREFERIIPVIRGGGYIPGSDHQVAPATSLENYKYYISKLHEAMEQCGADL